MLEYCNFFHSSRPFLPIPPTSILYTCCQSYPFKTKTRSITQKCPRAFVIFGIKFEILTTACKILDDLVPGFLAHFYTCSLHFECSPKYPGWLTLFFHYKSALNIAFSDKLSLIIIFFSKALITNQYKIRFLLMCLFLSLPPEKNDPWEQDLCFTTLSPAPSTVPSTV